MVAPPTAYHSTAVPCFYGRPGFLHKHSQLQISFLPTPQAVSSQPMAVLSPGLLSIPHVPTPSPCKYQWAHVPVWGMQGCGTYHLHKSHSVLSATDQLFHPPPRPSDAPLLSQLISPSGGFPTCGNLSSSAPHKGCRFHPTSSPLLFPFFFLSSYLVMWRSFLSFLASKSSASVQLVLCENCSICRCILDAFVKREKLHLLLLLHHLPLFSFSTHLS